MNKSWVFPLLIAASTAYAGVYDQPYSIIETDPSPSADRLLRPVIVNRVDGENAEYRNRAVVAPGRHDVTIDLPPRQGFNTATQETFQLETKPCTRYLVSARLHSTVGQKWEPVVRSEEPIGECHTKFRVAGSR
jgi:hypothetical protein